jgi:hypothetical protein
MWGSKTGSNPQGDPPSKGIYPIITLKEEELIDRLMIGIAMKAEESISRLMPKSGRPHEKIIPIYREKEILYRGEQRGREIKRDKSKPRT